MLSTEVSMPDEDSLVCIAQQIQGLGVQKLVKSQQSIGSEEMYEAKLNVISFKMGMPFYKILVIPL